jgi:hypothetical protein
VTIALTAVPDSKLVVSVLHLNRYVIAGVEVFSQASPFLMVTMEDRVVGHVRVQDERGMNMNV